MKYYADLSIELLRAYFERLCMNDDLLCQKLVKLDGFVWEQIKTCV